MLPGGVFVCAGITLSATILDMRTTALLLAALVLALPVAAQTAKPEPTPAKVAVAPTISDAQKAAYWKAAMQQSGAQKQLDAANATATQAIQAMVATCGDGATLQQAPNGDPECVLKPAEKKPAEKK